MFLAMASNVLSARTFAFPLLKYLRNCISCFQSPKEPSACILRFVLKRIPFSDRIRSGVSSLIFIGLIISLIVNFLIILFFINCKSVSSKNIPDSFIRILTFNIQNLNKITDHCSWRNKSSLPFQICKLYKIDHLVLRNDFFILIQLSMYFSKFL